MVFADGDEERKRESGTERENERAKGARMLKKGTRLAPYTCARGLNEWRREEGVAAWRFHYGDVSLRQTYAPNVVPALAVYISRYFIFIRPA